MSNDKFEIEEIKNLSVATTAGKIAWFYPLHSKFANESPLSILLDAKKFAENGMDEVSMHAEFSGWTLYLMRAVTITMENEKDGAYCFDYTLNAGNDLSNLGRSRDGAHCRIRISTISDPTESVRTVLENLFSEAVKAVKTRDLPSHKILRDEFRKTLTSLS